jgi:hypothetical protein
MKLIRRTFELRPFFNFQRTHDNPEFVIFQGGLIKTHQSRRNEMTMRRKLNFRRNIKSNLKIILPLLALSLSIISGCSHTQQVLIPPQMDLSPYRIIGVIEFSTNGDSELRSYLTQNYLQTVQSAQPEVRFLELGSQDLVLSRVSRTQLDYEAVKSIGRVYNVDAVMFGHLNLSEPKPNVRLSTTWQSMKAGADVEASLITKLWEADSGVIRWTNSSQGRDSIARLSASTSGNFHFGAKDPKETYGKLIPQLVWANTEDFRAHYETRRVK